MMIKIEKPVIKPIPMWKWILLHFCPAHISIDTEGDICCASFVKVLFRQLYVVRIDYYGISTGNLLRTSKLTRRGAK